MIKPLYLTKYATATATASEMVSSSAFPQRIHYCPDTYRGWQSGLRYPPHQMADKVVTPELIEYVRGEHKKTAFIMCAGTSNFAGLRNTHSAWNPIDYRFFPLTLTQVYAGKTASRFGKIDSVTTDSSACASSLKVLMDAQMMATLYGFERFIILAVEDQVNETVQKFFGELQATISKDQEEAGLLPSAFDAVNYGFNIAQGSVCAVLETEPKDGPVMLGAYAGAEDFDNAVGQREDGEGFFRAAVEALRVAGLSTIDINIVKTHGTGTKSNNLAEKNAITQLLGDSGYVATSFKPTLGHTFGASGLLETCLLIDSMKKHGCVPAIANRTEDDPVFLSSPAAVSGGNVLSFAAGMGNIYAASVWRI